MLAQVSERVWSPDAVHDTVAVVTRDPAFRRSLRQSIGEKVLLWILDVFDRIGRLLPHGPSSRTLVIVLVGLLVLLVAARLIIAAQARSDELPRERGRGAQAGERDPWATSLALEADARYEDAAHALYRGVVSSVARQERLRVEASKTSGDYARELRRRDAPSYESFRSFVRHFDRAVYGHGPCTAEDLTALRSLAQPFAPRARAA